MKIRILKHEKDTDAIRIGGAFETNSLPKAAEKILHKYASIGITKHNYTEHWSRVAIVDAETLAVKEVIFG